MNALANAADKQRPVLLFVEGTHDIEFLRRISRMLHVHDPTLPDLGQAEHEQRVIFVPTGGIFQVWAHRLAGLGLQEFHLYDREVAPMTHPRQELVEAIDRRPGCVATLTSKRALENYLSSAAIQEACGMTLDMDDQSDVHGLLARMVVEMSGGLTWDERSRRGRGRLRNRIKKWLSTVIERMTLERLTTRDPDGEVIHWLATIASLLRLSS